MIKPKKLEQNDKVAIVSLSSGILGEKFCKHQLALGIKRLNMMGLNSIFMDNTLKGVEFIKNNPKARADDLKQAFQDLSIKAIICAIGGDDTFKTIPYLLNDLEFISCVKNNPKVFIGFSDSTNNHFVFNKLGLVTYYGLNFLSDICELSNEMIPYTKESYERFFRNDDVYQIKESPVWYENRVNYSVNSLGKDLIKHNETVGHETLYGKGKVRGIFFGGCLESIYDLYSSDRYNDQRRIYDKYDLIPDTNFYKDKLFFVETSEEQMTPIQFEKILEYFIDIKVLTNIKALIVGKPYDQKYFNEYRDILIKIGSKIELPIIYNVNFGHALPRAMIPYGVMGEIDLNKSELKIVEKIFSE
jgi:muramoyltetrapeptide carboxypeptidase LdcA involved in peptidoglycan recycling